MTFTPIQIHHMKKQAAIICCLFLVLGWGCANSINGSNDSENNDSSDSIQFWLTDPGRNLKFSKQTTGVELHAIANDPTIEINPEQPYQKMDGFGFSLTGGSALHIHQMSYAKRQQLLTELFDDSGDHIGVSYLRISIGASDLDETVFSYNDLPAGQTDVEMHHFSLDPDRKHLIPVLKEILFINPGLKIMASPWSPPAWMKTNASSIGGILKPKYHDAYAAYFVKYIQEMASEGIVIDAVTIQNEPLHDGNNPSLYMPANQQAIFIKNSLGPAFLKAEIRTKIIIYDHNADHPEYPVSILNDIDANPFIDGSAFHLYGGGIDDISIVHDAHPEKNVYFTEQWIGAPSDFAGDLKWHIREIIIGAARNWCKTILEWNLAADENQRPHTPGGCDKCLGALTIKGDEVTRNTAYYIIGHIAKFVRPGSYRIQSTSSLNLPNAAFRTPDGKIVIVVLNNRDTPLSFNMMIDQNAMHSSLSGGAAGTYVWPIE